MNFLPVPKIMQWDWNLSQRYSCNRSVLITSGCSFTASTMDLSCASSWPGFVRDRCRFTYAEDWSFPGAGNFYISQSIIESIENKTPVEREQCFVAVMWSGISREEYVQHNNTQPKLSSGSYVLTQPGIKTKLQQTKDSYQYIKQTQKVLEQYNVPYAFTFYMNLLEPPFIPARDKTHRFSEFVDGPTLDDLLKLQVINSKDSLYDFSFYHNYINQSSDGYHPTDKCTLDWTDNILLPALAKQGLICST